MHGHRLSSIEYSGISSYPHDATVDIEVDLIRVDVNDRITMEMSTRIECEAGESKWSFP